MDLRCSSAAGTMVESLRRAVAAQEPGAFLDFITAVLADERTDTITEFKYR